MCCRALLAAVAVTCTFTAVQANGPTQIKDILCVLILNGLQKEDFDVSTLRKLQRHNVNIEDMNNEEMRKECEMVNNNKSIINTDLNDTVKLKDDHLIGDKEEDQRTKLNDSNLFNTITNYFSYVKPNNSGKVSNEDVQKFINVWNIMSRTKEYVVETTTKAIESSTFFMSRTATSRQSNEKLEYINKILENYINNQKITTTTQPTSNIVDYDLIAQKIKDLLANDNKNTQKPLQTIPTVEENLRRHFDKEEPLYNASIQSTRKVLKPHNKTSNRKHTNHQEEKRFLLDDTRPTKTETEYEDPKYKSNAKKEINTLSEDIIRELSESVRAKVLQDLKKIITTTTATKKSTRTTKLTTVRETTTIKPTETTTVNSNYENKERAVTDVLAKFMEMYQQFKTNKEIPTTKNVTEDTNIRTEGKTPTVNINVIKPVPVNITSVLISPFSPIHAPAIQTAVMPNEHYNLLNIHTPLQNLVPATLEHKITQLNIYNTKNNIRASPITIQTNSVEVHPLGLPAQQSFVYQNIVVTTKRPLKVPYDFPYYKSQVKEYEDRKLNERKYEDRNAEYPRSSRVHYFKDFGIGKHERSREFINDEYAKERNKRKPIKYKEYGRSHYNDRNVERFHEKLERADDWPRNYRDRSRESRNIDDNNYSTAKLISRQQLPINNAKKRSAYDDAHFRNFMKTQQKVNDMLERILATKTNSNPRSVETTV